MKFMIRVLTLSFLVTVQAFPQNGRRVPTLAENETIRLTKIATAVRINDEISIDGHLDEAAWQLATPLTDFIQRVPNTGKPATGGNDVRFLYDDDNLYVGYFAYDDEVEKMSVNELRED